MGGTFPAAVGWARTRGAKWESQGRGQRCLREEAAAGSGASVRPPLVTRDRNLQTAVLRLQEHPLHGWPCSWPLKLKSGRGKPSGSCLSVCLTSSSRPLASSLPLSCTCSPHGSICGPFNSQCRHKVPQKEATGLTWGRCPPQTGSAVGGTDCANVWQVPGNHVAGPGSSGSQKERVGPHQTSGASRPLPWPELADTWP